MKAKLTWNILARQSNNVIIILSNKLAYEATSGLPHQKPKRN